MSDDQGEERGATAKETSEYWKKVYDEALVERGEIDRKVADPGLGHAEREALRNKRDELDEVIRSCGQLIV